MKHKRGFLTQAELERLLESKRGTPRNPNAKIGYAEVTAVLEELIPSGRPFGPELLRDPVARTRFIAELANILARRREP